MGEDVYKRQELDWLLYNKPLEYAQLVLGGEIEHYLLLGCDPVSYTHLDVYKRQVHHR